MLQDAFPEVTLPQAPLCSRFMLPDLREYWEANLNKFPAIHRKLGAAFQVDRILPLPQPVREALIDLYFDDRDDIKENAKKDEENQHCIVRVYLGECETPIQATASYDSLRNFPMRLNMVEDLQLSKFMFATEMAIVLAVIHWQAQVDAMDTEFVLGSAVTMRSARRWGYTIDKDTDVLPKPRNVTWHDFKKRPIHMWVLDFDKANPIKLTPNDVDKKLVPAFLGNDPYYPRPDVDQNLWEEFSAVYLKASRLILEKKQQTGPVTRLPERFLDKVADTIK